MSQNSCCCFATISTGEVRAPTTVCHNCVGYMCLIGSTHQYSLPSRTPSHSLSQHKIFGQLHLHRLSVPAQMGILETCGKFSEVKNPGLAIFPWPFTQMVSKMSTRVQQLDVKTVTKTKDNVTITVMIAIQYRVLNEMVLDCADEEVGNPASQNAVFSNEPRLLSMDRGGPENHGVFRAYYRLTNIVRQLTPYVEDVVRSEVPKRTLDEAYESKEAVAIAVKEALQHEMKRYGYEIVNALVTDLQPDGNVLAAMNQIEAQRRMRMAAQEKAEGEKILIVKAAEADAESKYLSGQGVARQRKAIVEGLKESVLEFNQGVIGTSPADVMQLMMVTQYLDMLKDVGSQPGSNVMFIPHTPGAVQDVQSQMRQGFLEANAVCRQHSHYYWVFTALRDMHIYQVRVVHRTQC